MFRKPDLKPLADKVYVSLGSNQVTGQISLPLNGLAWLAKGRYLNGQATFNVSLANGVLFITADQMQVKGHPLPETFMQEVRKDNLASEISRDPRNAEVIRKLGSIRVEDGRAIIEAKKAP